MSEQRWKGGVLRQQWDGATRTYTEWDSEGEVLSTRPFTVEENAWADSKAFERTASTNRAVIETQAATALATNKTFVGIAAPSNAQNAAQIKALSRQMNGVIRMLLNRFEGTD